MIWNLKRHEISNDMKSQMTRNVKRHKISNILKCKMSWNVKCHEMLILMLNLWPQAETPGVTHFGAYNRPPDGHFFINFNVFQRRRGVCRVLPQQFRMARNTETAGGSWLPALLRKVRRWRCPHMFGLVAGVCTVLPCRRLCRRPRLSVRCSCLIALCFLSTAGEVFVQSNWLALTSHFLPSGTG